MPNLSDFGSSIFSKLAMAGTFGEYHGRKEVRAIDFAKGKGWPLVGINDSGGARLQEGMDTLEAYGWLFRSQILASGIIPLRWDRKRLSTPSVL